MNDKTVLLNGGRTLHVTPVDGADQFLAQLLGAAPSRPAIPTLRLVDDPAGARCVGVFIGSTHIGYLLNDIDEALVATLQACDHHGAVARARATVTAAWEDPEMAVLTVDLADSDRLLTDAGPASPPPDAPEVERRAEPPSSAMAESAGVVGDDSAPGLAAGYTEYYPDWPPRKSQASPAFETARAPAGPPTPAESSAQAEASLAEPVEPEMAPQTGWLATAPQQPTAAQPEPSMPPAATGQTSPPRATGWLGGQQPAPGTEGAAMGTASTPPAQGESWQDHADRPRDPESQFVTGWTAGAAQAQTVPEIKPAGVSDTTKAWLVGVLAFVVMATAGFLVWKTQFASKTYTDDQYGYSFSYPGRWEFEDESGMPPFASLATFGADDVILDFAAAGHGDSPEDIAALGVCLFDPSSLLVDPSRLQAELETNLALAASQDPSLAIVEPVYAATLGGVPGYRFTISATSMGNSVMVTYCLLVDEDLLYVLLGIAPESSWSDNSKAFEDFFRSFKPATVKM